MPRAGYSYDVFLSFRGPDTRDQFTCFLNSALKREGLETFMDDESIRSGEQIGSTIKEGIKRSMSAIIVFSEDYASSKWCLDELLLILERKRTSAFTLLPIYYYGVEPADIKYQRKKYREALENHKKWYADRIAMWRDALAEVGDYKGSIVAGNVDKFISKIVEEVNKELGGSVSKINPPPPSLNPQPGGIIQSGLPYVLNLHPNLGHMGSFFMVTMPNLPASQQPPKEANNIKGRENEEANTSQIKESVTTEEPVKVDLTPSKMEQSDRCVDYPKKPGTQKFKKVIEHQKLENLKRMASPPTQEEEDEEDDNDEEKAKVESQRKVPVIKTASSTSQNNIFVDCPNICPPGGKDKVVLYTFSSAGVTTTSVNCTTIRKILQDENVNFEERDANKDPNFRKELQGLVPRLSYPRLFVMGRDIGDIKKVESMNKSGQLLSILLHFKTQKFKKVIVHQKLENSKRMASPPTQEEEDEEDDNDEEKAKVESQRKMPVIKTASSTSTSQNNIFVDCPNICPPGGKDKVVLYTWSTAGVTTTSVNCTTIRKILQDKNVNFEERDASKDPNFRKELQGLVPRLSYPRLFVMGRDIGDIKKVESMNKSGQLQSILLHFKMQNENVQQKSSRTKDIGHVKKVESVNKSGSSSTSSMVNKGKDRDIKTELHLQKMEELRKKLNDEKQKTRQAKLKYGKSKAKLAAVSTSSSSSTTDSDSE